MKIKKYTGHSIGEVLKTIKSEMGGSAVIISRRNVRQRGIKSFFLPRLVEVTAAVDDMPPAPAGEDNRYFDGRQVIQVQRELQQMREMLQSISDNKHTKKAETVKRTGIKKRLLQNDVNECVIDSIIHDIKDPHFKDGKKERKRIADTMVMDRIHSIIKAGCDTEGRVVAFIGPTGVGKTTTIAKLAAINTLTDKMKVGLLTIDTYRIGAVEQLKAYADILGVPFASVNSIKDIDAAMDNLKDCERVYVDTTGRSTKNLLQLSELKLYLRRIKPDNISLVLSMTTKYRDMIEILKGFSEISYDNLILTKFDETNTYGSIINLSYNTDVPISYITVGQNVPQDIQRASSDKLLNLALGEEII